MAVIYLAVLIALAACGGEQASPAAATGDPSHQSTVRVLVVPAGPTATTVPSPTPDQTTLAQPGATQAPTDTLSPEVTRINSRRPLCWRMVMEKRTPISRHHCHTDKNTRVGADAGIHRFPDFDTATVGHSYSNPDAST